MKMNFAMPENKAANIDTLITAAEYLKSGPRVKCDPWPDYPASVLRALDTLEDINYAKNYEKLDPDAIETMTLDEIATMYTFIRRGERFCDGHIAGFIEDGRLYRLVRRHIKLLEEK